MRSLQYYDLHLLLSILYKIAWAVPLSLLSFCLYTTHVNLTDKESLSKCCLGHSVSPFWPWDHSFLRKALSARALPPNPIAYTLMGVASGGSPCSTPTVRRDPEHTGRTCLSNEVGNAVVGNQTPTNATKVDQVSCESAPPNLILEDANFVSTVVTPGDPGGPMVGNPANATSRKGKSKKGGNPAFSNQSLFVPSANSTNKQVGFTNNASSSEVTTKFIWYGHFLLVETDSGEYTSLFYAKKSDQDDVFSLQWNITDEDDEGDFVSVSMRSIPPSNED